MAINEIREKLEDYVKDTKLNLSKLLAAERMADLNPSQILGVALASAYVIKNRELIQRKYLNKLQKRF